jgi:hypothetical protein
MKKIFLVIALIINLISCKKVEGPGGTSTIRGTVYGQNFTEGEKEVTQIIFTTGSLIEHGDYFILNSTISSNCYYVYYTNPTWISDADPHLEGRIGIPVSYNYSDANTTIAEKTFQALSTINTLNFDMELHQDILVLRDFQNGEVADADDVSSPFVVDVSNQGKNGILGQSFGRADERIYIVYGKNEFASKSVRTDETGRFSFEGLQKGTYKVYVISEDTLQIGSSFKVEKVLQITDSKQIIEAGDFSIFY